MGKPDIDWRIVASKAMRTRAGFESLLILLEPWIKSTSLMFCRNDPQGAAQEARSHIFVLVYKQKRVDLSKSSAAIGNYFRSDVRWAITKEARRVGRGGMNCISRGRNGVPGRTGPMRDDRPAQMPLSDGDHIHANAVQPDSTLPFPLPLYAEYLEQNGTIKGAAQYCETRYGYDAKKVEAEFQRVVAELKPA